MKFKRDIFNKLNICGLFGIGLLVMCCNVSPSFAASSNGCDDDKNDRINPVLALCSSHTYNIGLDYNPTNDSDKQLMRDVVALKSTVMMQQMYKQYEFLDATLSRLKTQLERSILTSKLEAAGASSSSSATASSSNASSMPISGAENCRNAGTTSEVMNCLSRNLNRISAAINSSSLGEAKRQIGTDLTTLTMYNVLQSTDTAYEHVLTNCQDLTTNRQKLTTCVDYMRVCITRNIESLQNQNRNNSQQYRYFY